MVGAARGGWGWVVEAGCTGVVGAGCTRWVGLEGMGGAQGMVQPSQTYNPGTLSHDDNNGWSQQ